MAKKIISILIFCLVLVPFVTHGAAWDPANLANYGLSNAPIAGSDGIISNILLWLLGIFGGLGVLAFVVSGIMYVTATGDENRIDTAKKIMTYAIIGLVVGLSGWVIVLTIDYLLG